MTLERALTDILGPLGFCRVVEPGRGKAWQRELGDYVQTIDIQLFPSDLSEATINVRVADKFIWRVLLAADPFRPRVLLDNVDERLNGLMGRNSSSWKRSNPADQLEICEAIVTYAVPLIERVSSPEGMRDYLESKIASRWGGTLGQEQDLAILHWRLGNRDRGPELLAEQPRRVREHERAMAVVEGILRLCREGDPSVFEAKPS
jgi:hypothetical protein